MRWLRWLIVVLGCLGIIGLGLACVDPANVGHAVELVELDLEPDGPGEDALEVMPANPSARRLAARAPIPPRAQPYLDRRPEPDVPPPRAPRVSSHC